MSRSNQDPEAASKKAPKKVHLYAMKVKRCDKNYVNYLHSEFETALDLLDDGMVSEVYEIGDKTQHLVNAVLVEASIARIPPTGAIEDREDNDKVEIIRGEDIERPTTAYSRILRTYYEEDQDVYEGKFYMSSSCNSDTLSHAPESQLGPFTTTWPYPCYRGAHSPIYSMIKHCYTRNNGYTAKDLVKHLKRYDVLTEETGAEMMETAKKLETNEITIDTFQTALERVRLYGPRNPSESTQVDEWLHDNDILK